MNTESYIENYLKFENIPVFYGFLLNGLNFRTLHLFNVCLWLISSYFQRADRANAALRDLIQKSMDKENGFVN